jgi:hypothetical protein
MRTRRRSAVPIAIAVAVIAGLAFGGGCNSGYHQGTWSS